MVAYDRASAPLQSNWMLSSTSMRCGLSTPARFAMRCTLHLQGSRTQSVPAVEPWVRVPTAWAQPTALASRVPGTGAASCCHEPTEGLLYWCSSWSDLAEGAPAPMCRSAAHFMLEHMHAEVTCAGRASADRRAAARDTPVRQQQRLAGAVGGRAALVRGRADLCKPPAPLRGCLIKLNRQRVQSSRPARRGAP